MDTTLKVLLIDAGTGFYRVQRYRLGDFFGPVDLGLHLDGRHRSLNIGTGLLAGSIFPGSNRLVFAGFSPCWRGFYVSSMGGAGLVFDNLGLNMVSIVGRAPTPAILYLNRSHGEEVEVQVEPVDLGRVFREGRGGFYSLLDHAFARFAGRYETEPRILAVGPAAQSTDFGAIGSVPVVDGKLTAVDTWAGRGGLGSSLLQEHGIAAVIYGGTFVDEDFRNREVADKWFQDRYQKKVAAKDFEATTKYRFDPKFGTGGTLGVNYASVGGRLLAFNYRTIYMEESERRSLHERLILGHYLKQFNEETIQGKQQATCGEPCVAVCKKLNGEFKKDYEPYQALGPLCGVFDQRAAETLVRAADAGGFDAIAAGGVVAWLMECLDRRLLTPEELGVRDSPVFGPDGFAVETDSMHNAGLGVELLQGILQKRGLLDLSEGPRKLARRLSRTRGREVLDPLLYNAFGRQGWMVPNQYWTPGVLAPMAVMGKYYMYYGEEFLPPRELGRKNAMRLKQELLMDNLGICRFHRAWAEEMLPEIVGTVFGQREPFLQATEATASRLNSRNVSVYWESERAVDFVQTFLRRKREVDGDPSAELSGWIDRFARDKREAALEFWYELHKGAQESLREF